MSRDWIGFYVILRDLGSASLDLLNLGGQS